MYTAIKLTDLWCSPPDRTYIIDSQQPRQSIRRQGLPPEFRGIPTIVTWFTCNLLKAQEKTSGSQPWALVIDPLAFANVVAQAVQAVLQQQVQVQQPAVQQAAQPNQFAGAQALSIQGN